MVIAIYNTEQYLKKCIDSVINQTYKNIEIWLVDDGSTDSSLNICYEYAKQDCRINVIHKDNGGLSSARNIALESMNGEYVTFIDSDDLVSENWIEALYNSAKTNDSLIAVGAICTCSSIRKQYFPVVDREGVISTEQGMIKYITETHIRSTVTNKLFHCSLFESLRFPVGKIYEDAYVTPQLICKSNKMSFSKEGYYFIRIRQGSITKQQFSKKNLDLLYASDNMLKCYNEHYPKLKKLVTAHRINEIGYLLKLLFTWSNNKVCRDIEPKLKDVLTEAIEEYESTNGEMYGYSISDDVYLYLKNRTKYISMCKRNLFYGRIRNFVINIVSLVINKKINVEG